MRCHSSTGRKQRVTLRRKPDSLSFGQAAPVSQAEPGPPHPGPDETHRYLEKKPDAAPATAPFAGRTNLGLDSPGWEASGKGCASSSTRSGRMASPWCVRTCACLAGLGRGAIRGLAQMWLYRPAVSEREFAWLSCAQFDLPPGGEASDVPCQPGQSSPCADSNFAADGSISRLEGGVTARTSRRA